MIKIDKNDILEYCSADIDIVLREEICDWLTNPDSDQFTENILEPLKDYMLERVKAREEEIIAEIKAYIKELIKDDFDSFVDTAKIKKEAQNIIAKEMANKAIEMLK